MAPVTDFSYDMEQKPRKNDEVKRKRIKYEYEVICRYYVFKKREARYECIEIRKTIRDLSLIKKLTHAY